MSNEITLRQDKSRLIAVLESSLYPGAQAQSIEMVLGYCEAAGLDPMLKPVHIVPMWDSKAGRMRDVVMPGVGLYRTQASRTGQFAGMSEPEFGPDIAAKIGGQDVTYPEWCRVTVRRVLPSGIVAEFTAREYWIENYAVKGGKEKSVAPNAMWAKRPKGQLAKCASAQALRTAFPELGAAPTADEMEGKTLSADDLIHGHVQAAKQSFNAAAWIDRINSEPTSEGVKAEWAMAARDARECADPAGHAAVKSAVTARLSEIARQAEDARTVEVTPREPGSDDDFVAEFEAAEAKQ